MIDYPLKYLLGYPLESFIEHPLDNDLFYRIPYRQRFIQGTSGGATPFLGRCSSVAVWHASMCERSRLQSPNEIYSARD